MKKAFSVLLISFLFITISALQTRADSIYGPIKEIITMEARSRSRFDLRIEELAALTLSDPSRFLNAIEIKVKQSSEILEYRNSFAFHIFTNVAPLPTIENKTYKGEATFVKVLPPRIQTFFQIPLYDAAERTISPDTFQLPFALSTNDFPIMITILPVMKGIPDSLYSEPLQVEIFPQLADKGALNIHLSGGAAEEREISENIDLYIDKKRVEYPVTDYILPSGIHHVEIHSDVFSPKTTSFSLTKGEILNLDLELERSVPQLIIEAPENSTTYLDGNRIRPLSGERIEISEGEHSITIQVGNYSLSERFTAKKGKSYVVSLMLDLMIKER